MSDVHNEPEADAPAVRKAIIAVAIAFVVFAIGVTAFVSLLRHDQRVLAGATVPAEMLDRAEIGIVNQRLFDVDARTPLRLEAERRRLGEWGWADKKSGLIREPIDVAIQQIIDEAKQ